MDATHTQHHQSDEPMRRPDHKAKRRGKPIKEKHHRRQPDKRLAWHWDD